MQRKFPTTRVPFWIIALPIWFPTAFAVLGVIFVWRKTRPKINPTMAFPVEMGKPNG